VRVALAFLKRDFLIATSYRVAFALDIVYIFFIVPLFYFASRLFTDSNSAFLAPYGGNYFAFLLVGVAFLDYLALSLRTFNSSLRESQLMGTLEIVLLSPTALPKLLVYSSLWGYLFTSIRFFIFMILGLAFGLDFGRANIGAALLILSVAIPSFASFGILIASVTMLIKKGEVLTTVVSAFSLFIGGVLYPTSVLPEWLKTLSKFLPITHALEGMRQAVINGCPTEMIMGNVLVLVGFAAVLLPLGFFIFWWAVHWAKTVGTIAQY
jgi:ABC-2 type transport system permease protein